MRTTALRSAQMVVVGKFADRSPEPGGANIQHVQAPSGLQREIVRLSRIRAGIDQCGENVPSRRRVFVVKIRLCEQQLFAPVGLSFAAVAAGQLRDRHCVVARIVPAARKPVLGGVGLKRIGMFGQETHQV